MPCACEHLRSPGKDPAGTWKALDNGLTEPFSHGGSGCPHFGIPGTREADRTEGLRMDPALPGGASACEEPCHLRLSVLWNEWGRTTFIKMSPDQDDRGLLPRGRFRGERRLFCARRPGVQWPCTEQKGGSQWQRKMASGRCGESRHRIPGACTAQRNLRPSWRRNGTGELVDRRSKDGSLGVA